MAVAANELQRRWRCLLFRFGLSLLLLVSFAFRPEFANAFRLNATAMVRCTLSRRWHLPAMPVLVTQDKLHGMSNLDISAAS